MLKRSTSRNLSSRGARMKHVLQSAVLLGISFWLIYQVKYSHDKRRELSGEDAKLSNTEQVSSDGVKLGRKDLNPLVEDVDRKNERHVEEEEEEEDKQDEGEEEREEEMSKPEVDRSEDTRMHGEEEGQEVEEKEQKEEGQEGEEKEQKEEGQEGEEETHGDELEDRDKLRDEVDREEEFIDEEKEREEESSEDKEMAEGNEEEETEKQSLVEDENQNVAEDGGQDEVNRSNHEAREEQYKGDDASSAVTHDNNQLISSEMKKFNLNFVNESITTNKTNRYNNGDPNRSKSDGKEIEMAEKGLNLKETGADNKDNENGIDAAKVLEDMPPQNLTVSTENDGTNITSAEMNTEDLSTSSPPNATEIVLNSPQVHNSTVDGGADISNTTSNGKGTDSVSATHNAGTRESSNSASTDLALAVSDQKVSSDEKGNGVGNIRLLSTMTVNNKSNTENQESAKRQSESGEVKTG